MSVRILNMLHQLQSKVKYWLISVSVDVSCQFVLKVLPNSVQFFWPWWKCIKRQLFHVALHQAILQRTMEETFISHITTDYSWTLGEWQTFRNKNHDKRVCAKRGGLWKGWVGVINPFNAENFILLVLHISSQQSQRHTWLTPDTCPFSALCSTWELTHELWH